LNAKRLILNRALIALKAMATAIIVMPGQSRL
jgi:hypothetical protein